jgi:hypothetical protein
MDKFYIGQTVRYTYDNTICKVVDIFNTTLLLRKLWNDGTEWLSIPELCEPMAAQGEVLRHKDGLVAFG